MFELTGSSPYLFFFFTAILSIIKNKKYEKNYLQQYNCIKPQ